ncbi:MgtC/SapB family protein [Gemmatimonadota bacterium]
MAVLELAARFAAAAGLGLVLGLERERSQKGEKTFAGARTFAFIALVGAISAYLQAQHGATGLVVAAFLGVTALVGVAYFITIQAGQFGATTEVSALFTFLVGVLCGWGELGLASGVGVAGLLLLSIKAWSYRLAERISEEDVEAAIKFAVITAIILPILPNNAYGPIEALRVLNPFKIWLMVVLISGLNFASYILVKVVGQRHGLGLTGILGGLVSSTAVTLGFSQRSRLEPPLAAALTLGILLAWTVMFVRVVVMVSIVSPDLGLRLGAGIGLMAVVSLALCGFLWWRHRSGEKETETVKSGQNPFDLSEAVKFGLLFGVVTFVAKAAQVYFGDTGLYIAGGLAGLTDVDAISLSMANLANTSPADLGPAARTVLIAVMSNTLVKGGMAVFLGGAAMRKRMLPFSILLLASGVVAAFLIG